MEKQIFVASSYRHLNVKHLNPTGAVFHPEIQDHQDIAFQYSVDRVNMDRQLLPYTTLLVKEVNTSWTDSFTTGRRVCDMSGNRLTAVFGPYSPSTSSIVRSICENLGVPNIQAHWDMSHRPPGRCHINIHPDHNTMEQ
ncbi:unnamed protein product, partial [Timema podura]|nr:unnamed protein product [Timema podura]